MPNPIELNANKMVRYLNKLPDDFTKKDIIKYIEGNGIKMVNFRYVAEDGKLKSLNFVINDKKYLRLFAAKTENNEAQFGGNCFRAERRNLLSFRWSRNSRLSPTRRQRFYHPPVELAGLCGIVSSGTTGNAVKLDY